VNGSPGREVSIQLVSPASGDGKVREIKTARTRSFHSISFPSEWGLVLLLKLSWRIVKFPFN